MQNIDPYSYQCGVIDCFNEMVRSGVKALALSHPMDSAAERDALIPFARSCCHQYGNQLYIEDTPLLTDLFPLSLNQGKFNILFYRAGHILDQYLRLKERKANLVAERAYFGGNRSQNTAGCCPTRTRPSGGSFPTIRKRSVSESLRGRRLPPPSASFLLTWPGFRVIFV